MTYGESNKMVQKCKHGPTVHFALCCYNLSFWGSSLNHFYPVVCRHPQTEGESDKSSGRCFYVILWSSARSVSGTSPWRWLGWLRDKGPCPCLTALVLILDGYEPSCQQTEGHLWVIDGEKLNVPWGGKKCSWRIRVWGGCEQWRVEWFNVDIMSTVLEKHHK